MIISMAQYVADNSKDPFIDLEATPSMKAELDALKETVNTDYDDEIHKDHRVEILNFYKKHIAVDDDEKTLAERFLNLGKHPSRKNVKKEGSSSFHVVDAHIYSDHVKRPKDGPCQIAALYELLYMPMQLTPVGTRCSVWRYGGGVSANRRFFPKAGFPAPWLRKVSG